MVTSSPSPTPRRLPASGIRSFAVALGMGVLTSVAGAPVLAAGVSCESGLLERVQADYQSLTGFTARFTQSDLQADGRRAEAEGTLAYFKPGRMRWEYLPPNEQLLVTDGETVWLHDPLLDNVTVQPLRELTRGTPLAFLLGAGNLSDDFDCRSLSTDPPDDGLSWLELAPKVPIPALEAMQIGVDPDSARLAALRFFDTQGSVRLLRLHDLRTAVAFPEGYFRFEITPGMEVIRQQTP